MASCARITTTVRVIPAAITVASAMRTIIPAETVPALTDMLPIKFDHAGEMMLGKG
jgi:hypothetical protein